MRKDVKIGLIVGGALVLLIVIYLAFGRSSDKNKPSEVNYATSTTPGSSSDADNPPGPGSVDVAPTSPVTPATPSRSAQSGPPDWNTALNTGSTAPATPSNSADTDPIIGVHNGSASASTPDATDTVASGPRTHRIESGENFSTIAATVYGNSKYYLKIEAANPGVNPNRLKVGTVINLPAIDVTTDANSTASTTANTPAAVAVDSPGSSAGVYTVQSNDSLWKIAQKTLGDGRLGSQIYELNRQIIGPDPDRLKTGMVLKLPATAGADAEQPDHSTDHSSGQTSDAPSASAAPAH
jgi:nucleoid-associated protein YgaU